MLKDSPAPRHSPARSGSLHGGLRLALLGDSLAYGSGAARVQDTLGPRLAVVLEDAGFDVDLTVLAVPGAVSHDLAAQARRAVPLDVDLAVVVVGANDLARMVPPAQAAAGLAGALGTLRAAGADVVVVPAPDMSMVPFVPPAFRSLVQAASAALQREQAAVARAAGAQVAGVSDAVATAFAADLAMFSADRFHPSSAGYAVIADALAPHVLAAAVARRDDDAA
ncbi:GDSL-type esterase/lipase family protein [Geodermatophilus sabuli]|uniref:Lysophospholipase L1 n=1 Tax=Geodermatophilus sabuli TaxID=1564158 RepID=A0A285ECT2_9ACTN|nr:GDSL-type esterase/lipase family protein [Geodermatophilus sabuli]MBB3085695.1 lysophospholipase L1-like esterase [Geodermatophilus sabuli]SNX95886.1 Lysophospholipase L1 [Geodermatophilus sabuli]